MTYGFALAAVAAGFLLAGISGAFLLPLLARLQFRQHAYEDAPQSHQRKSGTPTMGGIAFVVALLPMLGFWTDPFAVPLFGLVAACAVLGFADDFSAVRRGRNAGLRARTKYLLTALVAALFLWAVSVRTIPLDVIFQGGNHALAVPHWLWFVLGIFAVTGTIHAVNLTDGLDGLATGTMLPPLLVFAAIALRLGHGGAPAIAALLGAGACLGFLLYNRHPAKLFMGDTGSLALGALLSGVAILSGEMLLLVVIGGVFVAEALSVIVQVTYFKRTGGKRIFRMSPLHHHFELSGWPETTVTSRFWLASVFLSGVGLAIVR